MFLPKLTVVLCFAAWLGSAHGERRLILGGKDVERYQYRWFALLHRPGEDYSVPWCGATLISERHVLTAAHCFDFSPEVPNESKLLVALGVYNRCTKEFTRRLFGVSSLAIHPNYTSEGSEDIAVMTLNKTASSSLFSPALLPVQDKYLWDSDEAGPDRGLIVGYGSTAFLDERMPCTMQHVELNIFTPDECRASNLPDKSVADKPYLLCAGKMEGGMDACQGDSGGGLMVQNENKAYVVLGIVSYGLGCGFVGTPGVYVRVSFFLDWISDVTGIDVDPHD